MKLFHNNFVCQGDNRESTNNSIKKFELIVNDEHQKGQENLDMLRSQVHQFLSMLQNFKASKVANIQEEKAPLQSKDELN